MKLKQSMLLMPAVFLISLLVLGTIVQSQTHILTETRRMAVTNALNRQNNNADDAAETLATLQMLKGSSTSNLEDKLNYIMSKESVVDSNRTYHNWPIRFCWSENTSYINELYSIYLITNAFKQSNAIDRLNKTALIDLVMQRYNKSEGAFHEPLFTKETKIGEAQVAFCLFPLEHYNMDAHGYADPNMISTYLAVSILSDLDALSEINSTKTLDWIMACKAENGGFKPSPEISFSLFASFGVDSADTNIASTYTAISTLRILGAINSETINAEKVKEYVLSCRKNMSEYVQSDGGYQIKETVRFSPHQDTIHSADFYSMYYALMTLHYLGVLKNETDTILKVTPYLMGMQNLVFTESGFIPTERDSTYGLFCQSSSATDTRYATTLLNVTGKLHFLDQPTPLVAKTWFYLIVMSIIASVLITGASILGISYYKRLQARKLKRETASTPKPAK